MKLAMSNQQLTTANKILTKQLQQALNTNTKLVHKRGTQPPTNNTPPPAATHGGRCKPFNPAK
jgi:hypothetical protein